MILGEMEMNVADRTTVHFDGKILQVTIANKASVIDDWVHDIRLSYTVCHHARSQEGPIVGGLDCKWSFHPVKLLRTQIVTLQLCINTKCLIIQMSYLDYIPSSLKDILNDPKYVFLGLEMNEKAKKMEEAYGIYCLNAYDLHGLVKIYYPNSYGGGKPSLKALALGIVGLKRPVIQNVNLYSVLTGMGSKVLDMQCIEIATIDAYACFRIAQKLVR